MKIHAHEDTQEPAVPPIWLSREYSDREVMRLIREHYARYSGIDVDVTSPERHVYDIAYDTPQQSVRFRVNLAD